MSDLTLGQAVRIRRLQKKHKGIPWTQQKLADVAGVTRGTVNSIENDNLDPGPGVLAKIEIALGTKGELREILWREGRIFKYEKLDVSNVK